MQLTDKLESLKGIGEKTAKLFGKLNIETIEDLLYFFPRSYEKIEEATEIENLQSGKTFIVKGVIAAKPTVIRRGSLSILSFQIKDATGSIRCVYFNMPYLAKSLSVGKGCYFWGRVGANGKSLQMEQPKILKEEEYLQMAGTILPVYSLTKGLSNQTIRKGIKQILKEYVWQKKDLPQTFLKQEKLMPLKDAIHTIHFPKDMESLREARSRFVFDEFFSFLLPMQLSKEKTLRIPSNNIMIETSWCLRLIEMLPYHLTDAQLETFGQIKEDMCGPYLMNRLIQGDVGSGKTIVAILALLLCIDNGYQGAFMAPTDVLARQHFETIKEMTEKYGLPFKPILLTGSLTVKEKRAVKEKIVTGCANLIVGTHALIQEDVTFLKLGLVVTDEQHRFGVNQREALSAKGENPHVLVMSATPIPRSLAMILYGDMNLSVMKELPKNRLPIKNCVISEGERHKAYSFMEKEIAKGRQIYVVCPMVDESEAMEGENVIDYCEKLREALPKERRISYLHGKMKPAQKNQIMEDFGAGNIDVLVSTTVIEVGIDVPNATLMTVENAERFGLAQLHQLRGRVGRGGEQSYCIFINTSKDETARERLDILNKSNDGFFVAEEDLRLRGPGDLFGIRQSGFMDFAVGDIYQDAEIMQHCNSLIEEMLSKENELYEEVKKYYMSDCRNSIDFRTI